MCLIDDFYAGPGDFYPPSKPVRARKPHRCAECCRDINRGEFYERHTFRADDQWYRHAICRHCSVGVEWLLSECRGFLYHQVLEDLEGHIAGYCPGFGLGVARLVVGMRRKWRRFAGPGLMPIPTLPPPIPGDHRG